MKKKDTKPCSKIDWNIVDQMLNAHCNGTEIAGHFGIHPNTLYLATEREKGVRFSEYSQQKKSQGKAMIRLKQFKEGLSGDRSMLIWLGKQYLFQSENPKHESQFDGKLAEILDKLKQVTDEKDFVYSATEQQAD